MGGKYPHESFVSCVRIAGGAQNTQIGKAVPAAVKAHITMRLLGWRAVSNHLLPKLAITSFSEGGVGSQHEADPAAAPASVAQNSWNRMAVPRCSPGSRYCASTSAHLAVPRLRHAAGGTHSCYQVQSSAGEGSRDRGARAARQCSTLCDRDRDAQQAASTRATRCCPPPAGVGRENSASRNCLAAFATCSSS